VITFTIGNARRIILCASPLGMIFVCCYTKEDRDGRGDGDVDADGDGEGDRVTRGRRQQREVRGGDIKVCLMQMEMGRVIERLGTETAEGS
jgi:hypothetical protein